MKPRDIDLRIERIALAAMPAGGERRLREAVGRELARIAGAAHHDARWPAPPPQRAARNPPDASGGRSPEAVATRVARQVQAGLSREAGR